MGFYTSSLDVTAEIQMGQISIETFSIQKYAFGVRKSAVRPPALTF